MIKEILIFRVKISFLFEKTQNFFRKSLDKPKNETMMQVVPKKKMVMNGA